ncbi:hypothetical protein BGZ81_000781 [Podila clonocystis]|nr:hypothetical protein BGZ81_000781 [Podila clonocystis]
MEQKAGEVDEKCLDLMERINVLVSHLVVLERIHNVKAMTDMVITVLCKNNPELVKKFVKKVNLTIPHPRLQSPGPIIDIVTDIRA